ncbi:MAG: ABC transporter substrate-binding protein [Caldisphaeraceae archaeon]|nr:ABC transporter substrate-binding protein [Caldisphaeraceae archaeon]MEB3798178.1 ABC transporter substrate-binding protein [Caldisphaeraceae archaeon]
MNASNDVVGISPTVKTRGYFPLMADKPVIGNQFRGLNYGLIEKLRPDVVILMDVGPIGQIIDKLNSLGIKCIVVSIYPSKIPYTIKLLGQIFGKEKRANELLNWWNQQWNFLEERIAKCGCNQSLKVFVAMGFAPTSRLPTMTRGQTAPWNYILEKLHMTNIAASKIRTSGELDLEYIIKSDPDIIIIGDWSNNWVGYNYNTSIRAEKFLEEIASNEPILCSIKAFKDHKVFVMDYTLLTGYESVIGAYYIAKAVYPQAFKNINPDKILMNFFVKFLGVPYRGVWFYPRPWLGEEPHILCRGR